MKTRFLLMTILISLALLPARSLLRAEPLGTAFTYQGRLLDNSQAANGWYDIQFRLYSDPNLIEGSQVGLTVTLEEVEVVDGYFIADLDFGQDVFGGQNRFLQIAVRPHNILEPVDYVALIPAQPLTAAPYAQYALQSGGFALPVALSGSGADPLFRIDGAGTGHSIYGTAQQDSGAAVYGYHANGGYMGYLGTNTAGVKGYSAAGYAGLFEGKTKVTGNFTVEGAGKVGIGTATPSEKLEVSGAMKASRTGADGPHLIIHDSNGSNDRPGIQFTNNYIHYIGGDDGSNEYFGFYSQYGNNRIYDAIVNIYGKATASWGKYLSLTHDGTNGSVSTDSGHILLLPNQNVGIGTTSPSAKLEVLGNMKVNGNLTVNGSISTSAQVSFLAMLTAQQSVPALSDAKIFFAGEQHDLNNNFDASASRFIAPASGVYCFSAALTFQSSPSADGAVILFLKVNGADTLQLGREPTSPLSFGVNGSVTIQLTSGDSVEISIRNGSSSPRTVLDGSTSHFSGHKVY